MFQRERESGVSLVLATLVVAALGAMAFAEGGPAAAPAKAATTQPAKGDSKHPRVAMETSLGVITIELDAEKAPVTVENFLKYVDSGYYDGTIFHRAKPDFMIQGGGFVSPTEQKSKGLLPSIANEAKNGLKNKNGTIAMARTGEPHSATSQFFINVADNSFLDYPSRDGWGYCVFGRVVEGMDVVDKMKNVETKANPMMGGEKSLPLNPPVIKSVKRVEAK